MVCSLDAEQNGIWSANGYKCTGNLILEADSRRFETEGGLALSDLDVSLDYPYPGIVRATANKICQFSLRFAYTGQIWRFRVDGVRIINARNLPEGTFVLTDVQDIDTSWGRDASGLLFEHDGWMMIDTAPAAYTTVHFQYPPPHGVHKGLRTKVMRPGQRRHLYDLGTGANILSAKLDDDIISPLDFPFS